MIRFTRTKREISQADQVEQMLELRQDLQQHRIPFFDLPMPLSKAHLNWLLFAHRCKAVGFLSWLIYPALLFAILVHWFITGLLVLTAIATAAACIMLANGPSRAGWFLHDSLREYGPFTW